MLVGGAGNDSLTGGSGADMFVYNTDAPFILSAMGLDTITDFIKDVDKIVLDKTTFTTLSSSAGTSFSDGVEFAIVTNGTTAEFSAADIIYNQANGNLFYNSNGAAAGFGTGGRIAYLTGNPSLAADDFVVQI